MNSDATRRILITGAGSIAKRHAVNLRARLLQVDIVVVTRDPVSRLADWPIQVRAVSSFEEGLATLPNAVMVCSVSSRHAFELMEVIKLKLPVFVEKPLLTSMRDFDHLALLIQDAHPASVIGCNLRFLPSLQQLKQALCEGMIGTLVRTQIEAGQWLPDWRPDRSLGSSYSADQQKGGGVLFDLVHEIDAALWLLGDLTLVAGLGGHFSGLPIQASDAFVGLLRAQNGHPVTISLDYVSRKPVRRYVFTGELGTLIWDMQTAALTLTLADEVKVLTNSPNDFLMAATYVDELAEWLAAIEMNVPSRTCDLRSSLPAARLMLDMLESAS